MTARPRLSLAAVLVVAALVFTAQPAAAATISVDSWEDGDFDEYNDVEPSQCDKSTTTTVVRSGSRAALFEETSGSFNEGCFVFSTSGLSQYPSQGDTWTQYFNFTSDGAVYEYYFAAQNETVKSPDGYFLQVDPLNSVDLKANRPGGATVTIAGESFTHGVSKNEWWTATFRWGSDGTFNISFSNQTVTYWLNGSDADYFDEGGTGYVARENSGADANGMYVDAPVKELRIKNESRPSEFVKNTLNVTFFGSGGGIRESQTSTGNVSISGLDEDQEWVARIEDLDGEYTTRTYKFRDTNRNHTTYLLNTTNRVTNDVTFVLDDRSGLFPVDQTTLIIERPLVINGNTEWATISSGNFGAANNYQVELEDGERYRLRVQNRPDERVLGTYDSEVSETVELTIGDVALDPDARDGPEYNASRTNLTNQPVQVTFEYNDTAANTSTIYLEIFEFNNASNVLLSNTSFSGPYGSFSNTENVPSSDNQTTWVVKFVAVRDDAPNVQGQIIVGPQRPVLDGLPVWLKTLMSVGLIIMVAGLFSQLNASIGSVVVAGVGGILFYINFVPPELGAGVMLLSLMSAGMIWINEHRGGNL